jgi:hypothetical protein
MRILLTIRPEFRPAQNRVNHSNLKVGHIVLLDDFVAIFLGN